MARRYLMDSNAVSDILRGRNDVTTHMRDVVNAGHEVTICSIVYYEIERGLKASGSCKKLQAFYNLYESLSHLYLDRQDLESIKI